jgi:hypothetical protein
MASNRISDATNGTHAIIEVPGELISQTVRI